MIDKDNKIKSIEKHYNIIIILLLIAIIFFIVSTIYLSYEVNLMAIFLLLLPGIFTLIESSYSIFLDIHDKTFSTRLIYWFGLFISYIPIFIILTSFITGQWPTGDSLFAILTVIVILIGFSILAGWAIPIIIMYLFQSVKYRKRIPIDPNKIFENIVIYSDNDSCNNDEFYKAGIYDRVLNLILVNYRTISDFSYKHNFKILRKKWTNHYILIHFSNSSLGILPFDRELLNFKIDELSNHKELTYLLENILRLSKTKKITDKYYRIMCQRRFEKYFSTVKVPFEIIILFFITAVSFGLLYIIDSMNLDIESLSKLLINFWSNILELVVAGILVSAFIYCIKGPVLEPISKLIKIKIFKKDENENKSNNNPKALGKRKNKK